MEEPSARSGDIRAGVDSGTDVCRAAGPAAGLKGREGSPYEDTGTVQLGPDGVIESGSTEDEAI